MTRLFLAFCCVILLSVLVAPCLAAPAAQSAGIRLQARSLYGETVRSGTWLPIVLELENSGIDRALQVRVGDRAGAQYAVAVDLPGQSRKTVTVYAYLSSISSRLLVRLLEGDQELASTTLQLLQAGNRTHMLGVVTGQGDVLRPPNRLADDQRLLTVPIALADLPTHALGLSGLQALVLDDLLTSELSAEQLQAIEGWVLRGGQLILSGGTGLERTLAGLPSTLRPAMVMGVDALPATSLLGPGVVGAADLPVARLAPTPAIPPPYRLPLPLRAVEPPALAQSLGRGSVTAIAVPLTHPTLVAWEGAVELWTALLQFSSELPPGTTPDLMTFDGFVEGNLAATLTSLPALQFPPLGLLAGLLSAYILLVGPGTYLLLRRLDRLALGWIIVPALTLLFAALSYGLGYAQRGGDVMLNQVALIEPDEAAPLARVRSFVGLFSPHNRTYALSVTTATSETTPLLLRPISLQGPWDTSNSGGGIYLQEPGPTTRVDAFTVSQWSMRSLSGDSTFRGPLVAAQITLDGEHLTGEVRNQSSISLQDVTLLQGERVLHLGDLAPGERSGGALLRRAEVMPGMFGAAPPISYLVYGEELDRQSKPGSPPLAPEIQQRIRILDGLFSYGPSWQSGQLLVLAWVATPMLKVEPAEQRTDAQYLTLISATPRIVAPSGQISLDQAWLIPRFESGLNSACFGNSGTGLSLGPQPSVLQMLLPRSLYGMRATALRLKLSADNQLPDDLTVEFYNWATGLWAAQTLTAGATEVPDPAALLGSHGAMRLRLTSAEAQLKAGCVYLNLNLQGTLP